MNDAQAAARVRDEALDALERAESAAWRAHVTASLLAAAEADTVAYAAGDGDPCGVHLVAAGGRLLGEARTASRGPFGGWYAYPDGVESSGPYVSARGAAYAVALAALGRPMAITRHIAAGAGPGLGGRGT